MQNMCSNSLRYVNIHLNREYKETILDNWKTQDVSQFTLTSDSNPRSAGKYEVRQIKEEEHHNFELCET